MAQAKGSGTYLIQASSDMQGEASALNLLENTTYHMSHIKSRIKNNFQGHM